MPTYPYVEFTVSIGTWDWGSEAYPDTAFDGAISIPRTLAAEIDAEAYPAKLELADGTIRSVPAWSGTLWLENECFSVEIVAIGNRCLLGREVLDQIEICFRFGREVRLTFGRP